MRHREKLRQRPANTGRHEAIRRLTLIGCAAATVLALSAAFLRADDCVPAPGIVTSTDKFIDEVQAKHQAGQGSLPVTDALVGFQDISATDQKALDARAPVKLMRGQGEQGSFINTGPHRITVTGVFVGKSTFFQIPKLVTGHYISTPDSLTLIYDPAHAIRVGETLLGIKFSKQVNHSVVTRQQLLYFFEDNAGNVPDRCYTLSH